MANALVEVVDTFKALDAQYNLLRVACRTQADLDALDAEYAAAEENCEKCTNQYLGDDDAEIAQLCGELKTCNDELKKAVTEMGDMSKVLDNLTEAVTVSSQLIAKLP
jgi:chromosome segregation ATPase